MAKPAHFGEPGGPGCSAIISVFQQQNTAVLILLGVLLKRAGLFFVVVCAVFWTACGSSNGSSTTVSNIKDRLLFDNTESGGVNILNIDTNPPTIYANTVVSLTRPEQMLESPDRSTVLIYDDAAFNITVFNSAQETGVATLSLNYHTDSIVMSSDGLHAYAAVPDNPENNAPSGAVFTFTISSTTGTAGAQVPVPGARRVAISNDGKSLLVFADNNNSVYYINLAGTTFTAVAIPGFNQPYSAVFSSDNTTAYVLNCGTECSGATAPSVQPLTLTGTTPTAGTPLPVPGATKGLLNGSTLYVAGNDLTQAPGQQGTLTTVDVSNMTVGGTAAIADGLHTKMSFFANKLWIGSLNCTTTNCLSIFDTSSSAVTLGSTTGNVTSIEPAPVKNWMYVVQGGEIYQYDPTSLTPTVPYDVVGQAWDVKLLDQ